MGQVHERILGVSGITFDDEALLETFESKVGVRQSVAPPLDPDAPKPFGSRASAGRLLRELGRYGDPISLIKKCVLVLLDGTNVNVGNKRQDPTTIQSQDGALGGRLSHYGNLLAERRKAGAIP